MTELVFPLGHYLGDFRPGEDDLPAGHEVRVGPEAVMLYGDAELAAWALAHEPHRSPSSFDAAARDLLGPAADRIVEALADRGVLVRVGRGTGLDDPGGFADRYRLRPLLTAIGRVPDGAGSGGYAIGFGAEVAVVADPLLRDLWWWAGPSADLRALCVRVAAPDGGDPDGRNLNDRDPGGRDPAGVYERLLGGLHSLLAAGAAYLDLA